MSVASMTQRFKKQAGSILRKLVAKVIALPIYRHMAAFEAATCQPQLVQEELLRRILTCQSRTDFGREHRFADIRTIADYRRQLPISTYDYFEPYLARVRRGDFNALLADKHIHMFALTSGTTAARKYIPVTDQYLADYRRGWNMWGLRVFKEHANIRMKPIVQLSGDWCEFRTEAGIPCGAVTGLTANMQKRAIRWIYCIPSSVGRVKDAATKYYLAMRLSLPRRVGMIISANPSTLVSMARTGDQEKESLIRDIYDGTLNPRFEVPRDVRATIERRLRRRHPERARELEAIVKHTGTLYPRDYWPSDCLLGNWTGGSVGAYMRHYPRYFGDTPVRDIGLIASEGRFTIPLADGTPSGVLDITSHYFEFIPQEEADSDQPTVLGAHELEEGRTYYILPTTASGLYRYHIHDLVRVTGFFNQTPLVEFLSKGAHFANITGEKLSEHHVTQAMRAVLEELDLTLTAYTVAPRWDEELPCYDLFVEDGDLPSPQQRQRLIERLDQRLAELNIEYASKRDSNRLGPLQLEIVPTGTWQTWDRKRLQRTGGTLEQYKHPCLVNDFTFRESLLSELAVPVG